MSLPEIPAVWFASAPQKWPAPPEQMSLSRLKDIEACPRRSALSSADFPGIWSRHGYPQKPGSAAIAGRIVHLAVERVIRALSKARCSAISDPAAVSVIMGLGGYGRIVDECSTKILNDHIDNPRAQSILQMLQVKIQSLRPDIREQVQMLIARTSLVVRPDSLHPAAVEGRHKLMPGSHPEVSLVATNIAWKGTADLVELSGDQCEIFDFKTGEPHDDHRFQLHVYSALWVCDTERNPEGRLATKLTLCYQSGNVDVPILSRGELDALIQSLKARRQDALTALSRVPPEARPNKENCRNCGVRQLCDEYWSAGQFSEDLKDSYCDLEVTIEREHGSASWEGIAERDGPVPKGTKILLRTSQQHPILRAGLRLRLLGAHFSLGAEDGQPPIANLGGMSEGFVVRAASRS